VTDFAHRLYVGEVMHMRLRPFRHQFRYRVFTTLLDIDDLMGAHSRAFTIDGFNLFSFHRKDHGPRDGSNLRRWVDQRIVAAGLPRPARVMLLSMPRFLGWAFNPISVYFGYNRAGALESIIYEVKNTFGDQHPYVHDARPDSDGAARHRQAKEMYVSPFIEMDQTYRFTVRPPDDRLAIRIKQTDEGDDLLIATQSGVRIPLSDSQLVRLSLTHPIAAIKIFAAIHWQAIKLKLKGARFIRYPGAEKAIRPLPPSGNGQPHKPDAATEPVRQT
jgi:DUF1365 family protein